jgi:anti-anti-sigma regulatory factor
LYGIDVRDTVLGGTSVCLRGEFDLSSLKDLRGALDAVTNLREPVSVDLAGVTFLDLGCARELAVRSQLYAHCLGLRNPSEQVLATVRACGLEDWFNLDTHGKPVFSEAM